MTESREIPRSRVSGSECGAEPRRRLTRKHHGAPEPTQISESNEKLYASLAAGELDAVIDDSPIAKYFSQFVAGLQFAGILKGTEGAYAIMVRKGNNTLRTAIDRALGEMEKDGTQKRLFFKWFGAGQAKVSR